MQRYFHLGTGRRLSLMRPSIPFLHDYYVLAMEGGAVPSPDEIDEFWRLVRITAQGLAEEHMGDGGCHTVLYNAERTRRRGTPHAHIILARTTAEKRRKMLLLSLKHVLRWKGVRWVAGAAAWT